MHYEVNKWKNHLFCKDTAPCSKGLKIKKEKLNGTNKNEGNQFIFPTYSGNDTDAMRPSLGYTVPCPRVDDLYWKSCLPYFCFYDSGRFFHTANVRKYISRLFIFAIVSEIPFNLIYGSSPIYPFHQNVLWTFLIALLSITLIEKAKVKGKWWLTWPVIVITALIDYLLGTIAMVDYFGAGVLTVLVFYIFREKKWRCFWDSLYA